MRFYVSILCALTRHSLGDACCFQKPRVTTLIAFKGLIPEEGSVGKGCIVLHQRNMKVIVSAI